MASMASMAEAQAAAERAAEAEAEGVSNIMPLPVEDMPPLSAVLIVSDNDSVNAARAAYHTAVHHAAHALYNAIMAGLQHHLRLSECSSSAVLAQRLWYAAFATARTAEDSMYRVCYPAFVDVHAYAARLLRHAAQTAEAAEDALEQAEAVRILTECRQSDYYAAYSDYYSALSLHDKVRTGAVRHFTEADTAQMVHNSTQAFVLSAALQLATDATYHTPVYNALHAIAYNITPVKSAFVAEAARSVANAANKLLYAMTEARSCYSALHRAIVKAEHAEAAAQL